MAGLAELASPAAGSKASPCSEISFLWHKKTTTRSFESAALRCYFLVSAKSLKNSGFQNCAALRLYDLKTISSLFRHFVPEEAKFRAILNFYAQVVSSYL